MRSARNRFLFICVLCVLGSPLYAQESQLGKVEFPTSGSEQAQKHFLRGLAALHSFWYEEALNAFRDATKADPGFVMGYDFDSGLALVKPSLPLHGPTMKLGRADALAVGDSVTVVSSGGREPIVEARVVAKQEFAGRWEYVLDEAVFTAPPHDSWSGAALVDRDGRLCGLGSLVIQGFETRGGTTNVNMFVPIELLEPIIDEILEHGRRSAPPRPWLGMLVHDDHNDLTVVGVYRNCPADKAGLRPGDVIVGIDDEPVEGLANMFRRVWSLGSAGVDVPLNVLRNTEKMQLKVRSGDRAGYQRKGTLQ